MENILDRICDLFFMKLLHKVKGKINFETLESMIHACNIHLNNGNN